MNDPVPHTIRSDLGVAEAAAARDALLAALEGAGQAGLSLDLTAPRPTQVALQLLIAAERAAVGAGRPLSHGPAAQAALARLTAAPDADDITDDAPPAPRKARHSTEDGE